MWEKTFTMRTLSTLKMALSLGQTEIHACKNHIQISTEKKERKKREKKKERKKREKKKEKEKKRGKEDTEEKITSNLFL